MIKTYKKFGVALLIVGLTSVFTSCYDKFDPESYKPPFTISGFTAADEIEPASLVSYFSFDGDLADAVSGTAGENAGGSFVNGFKGKALSLNVADKSYVTFTPGDAITGLHSFTISFWVNPTFVDANTDNGIDGILGFVNLSNPSGFWGNIDWFVENGSNPSAATIKAHVTSGDKDTWIVVSGYAGLFGNWTNHTLTYDATTSAFKYYINGSSVATGTSSWGGDIGFTGSGPMVFGTVQFQTDPSIGCCGHQDWASYLTGSLDELRIYDKALTGEDVNALVVLQGKGK